MQFIGIELDSSGTHAVVLDLEDSSLVAEARSPHPWVADLPESARRQDPVAWIAAIDLAVRECLSSSAVDRSKIAGIGVAGPDQGIVCLDAENRVVRNTSMEGDPGSPEQASEISLAFGGTPGLLELLGQAPGANSAAAEILRIATLEPENFSSTSAILTIQDFSSYWLTGRMESTTGSASPTGLLDIRSGTWSGEMVEFISPHLQAKLPPLTRSDQPRGTLRADLARKWQLPEEVKVSAGGTARALSSLAGGCVTPDSALLSLGGNPFLAVPGTFPVIDLRGELLTISDAAAGFLCTAAFSNPHLAPSTISNLNGSSPSEYEDLVFSVPPGADGLLFLPYLAGESTPRLPDASGLIHGIRSGNFTPAHIARATAEGIALGYAYGMSRLRELGFNPTRVRLTSPTPTGPRMMQLLADTLAAEIVPLTSPHGPAVGAAMQAAIAFFHQCGEALGPEEISNYWVSLDTGSIHQPDPDASAFYEELLGRQQYLVDTLHPAGFL